MSLAIDLLARSAVNAVLAGIRRRAVRSSKRAARRPRAEWKPPRAFTPIDQIGRLDPEPAPPPLGTPTLSAFHRLSQH